MVHSANLRHGFLLPAGVPRRAISARWGGLLPLFYTFAIDT